MFWIPWPLLVLALGLTFFMLPRILLSFNFLSSTLLHMWLKLPWQAAVGRHVHPTCRPPHPDPLGIHTPALFGSLDFTALAASTLDPFMQLLCLLFCISSFSPFLAYFWHLPLVILDQFSNTEGCPSWFASLFLHELHHWRPDWSFTDFISWFILTMASAGCFLWYMGFLRGFSPTPYGCP